MNFHIGQAICAPEELVLTRPCKDKMRVAINKSGGTSHSVGVQDRESFAFGLIKFIAKGWVTHFTAETDNTLIDDNPRVFDSKQLAHLRPCARRAPQRRGQLANVCKD